MGKLNLDFSAFNPPQAAGTTQLADGTWVDSAGNPLPAAQPSFWQKMFSPDAAKQAEQANFQYGMQPQEAAQREATQRGIAYGRIDDVPAGLQPTDASGQPLSRAAQYSMGLGQLNTPGALNQDVTDVTAAQGGAPRTAGQALVAQNLRVLQRATQANLLGQGPAEANSDYLNTVLGGQTATAGIQTLPARTAATQGELANTITQNQQTAAQLPYSGANTMEELTNVIPKQLRFQEGELSGNIARQPMQQALQTSRLGAESEIEPYQQLINQYRAENPGVGTDAAYIMHVDPQTGRISLVKNSAYGGMQGLQAVSSGQLAKFLPGGGTQATYNEKVALPSGGALGKTPAATDADSNVIYRSPSSPVSVPTPPGSQVPAPISAATTPIDTTDATAGYATNPRLLQAQAAQPIRERMAQLDAKRANGYTNAQDESEYKQLQAQLDALLTINSSPARSATNRITLRNAAGY